MKLSLPILLKAWLVSLLSALVLPLSAATYTFNNGSANNAVEGNSSITLDNVTAQDGEGADNIIIMDLEGVNGGKGNDYFGNAFTLDAAVVQVKSWEIDHGYGSKVYTFNSSIVDYYSNPAEVADIIFYGWDNKDNAVTYIFKGDMSGFSGDIRASNNGQLTVKFEGTQRAAASGTGAIDIWTASSQKVLTYNITDNDGTVDATTVTNSSLKAYQIEFKGGATSRYDVASTIETQSLSIDAATQASFSNVITAHTIELAENATISLSGAHSSTISDINASAGSSLSIGTGTSLTISGTMASGLTVTNEGSLTLDGIWDFDGNITNNGSLTFGDSLQIDLTGQTFADEGDGSFSLTLTMGTGTDNIADWLASGNLENKLLGISTASREFTYENGVLSYTSTAQKYTFTGGDLDWTEGGSNFVTGGNYAEGGDVTISGTTTATLNSAIDSAILTVASGGNLTIENNGHSFVAHELILESNAEMLVTGAFDYTQISLGDESNLTLQGTMSDPEINFALIYGGATSTLTVALSESGSSASGFGNFSGNLNISSGLLETTSSATDALASIHLGNDAQYRLTGTQGLTLTLNKLTGEANSQLLLSLATSANATDLGLNADFFGAVVVESGRLSAVDSNLGGATQVILNNGAALSFDESSSSTSPIIFDKAVHIADGASATFYSWGGSAIRAITGAITGNANTTITQSDGGVIRLDNLDGYAGSLHVAGSSFIVNDDASLNKVTFASGKSIEIAAGKTVETIGADTGKSFYQKNSSSGYTIKLGDGSHFIDNTVIALAGGETVVDLSLTNTGTARYTIDGFVGANANYTNTTLSIGAGVTLESLATQTSSQSAATALNSGPIFMLAHYSNSAVSIIDVNGTLILNSGISNRDGDGTINVKSGGILELREGLFARNNGGSIALNVDSGGTLKLGDQGTDTNVISTKISGGATIEAISAETTIHNNIGLKGEGVVTLKSLVDEATVVVDSNITSVESGSAGISIEATAGQSFILNGNNSHAGGTSIDGEGTLQLNHNNAAGTGNLSLSDGAALVLGSGVALDKVIQVSGANNSINGLVSSIAGDAVDMASFTGTIQGTNKLEDHVTIKQDNLSANHVSLDNVTLDVDVDYSMEHMSASNSNFAIANGATLSVTNLTVDAASSLTSTGTLQVDHLTMTGVTVSEVKEDITITTLESQERSITVYTLTGLNEEIKGTESLTISVSMDEAMLAQFQSKLASNNMVGFELDGFEEYLALGVTYENVTININGQHYLVDGYDEDHVTISNLIVYVPEPSTASMALLALAGLLARRRRETI